MSHSLRTVRASFGKLFRCLMRAITAATRAAHPCGAESPAPTSAASSEAFWRRLTELTVTTRWLPCSTRLRQRAGMSPERGAVVAAPQAVVQPQFQLPVNLLPVGRVPSPARPNTLNVPRLRPGSTTAVPDKATRIPGTSSTSPSMTSTAPARSCARTMNKPRCGALPGPRTPKPIRPWSQKPPRNVYDAPFNEITPLASPHMVR
jgi:hypothetical protein